jgi:hypothetical protein
MAPDTLPFTIKELNNNVEKSDIGLELYVAFTEFKTQPELKVDE